jgi:hypothetical protein
MIAPIRNYKGEIQIMLYQLMREDFIESYEDIKMGRNLPGYEELDQSKREADDYTPLIPKVDNNLNWPKPKAKVVYIYLYLKGNGNKN